MHMPTCLPAERLLHSNAADCIAVVHLVVLPVMCIGCMGTFTCMNICVHRCIECMRICTCMCMGLLDGHILCDYPMHMHPMHMHPMRSTYSATCSRHDSIKAPSPGWVLLPLVRWSFPQKDSDTGLLRGGEGEDQRDAKVLRGTRTLVF